MKTRRCWSSSRPPADNLLAAEAAAGVRHHVALSIVAIDRTDNGYFRAKIAQEKLIKTSCVPYTIVRSTQFLEFLGGIADSSADGKLVRLPPVLFQPIAADDVAASVADVALAAPRNRIVEIAGPERAPFNEIIARYLKAVGDAREVVSDPEARYWGGRVTSTRSCRWARRASAASVSTNGSAAHRQQPDPASEVRPVCPSGSRATNERGDYDDQTRCVGSSVPHDRHGGGPGA